MNIEEMAEVIFKQLKPTSSNSLTEVLNEFSRGEIGMLSYLAFDKNEVLAGELSEKLSVSTARTASILNSLENKEYIIRREDNLDKRKTVVAITEKGSKIVADTKKEVINKIVKVINEIGYDEIKKYIEITLKIRNVLDK